MTPSFLNDLESLTTRFAHLNLTGDLSSRSLVELWAVYRFLRRLSGN